jgi:hypothetical protein
MEKRVGDSFLWVVGLVIVVFMSDICSAMEGTIVFQYPIALTCLLFLMMLFCMSKLIEQYMCYIEQI